MIATSSAFATANAALAKRPIYIVEIAGYTRAFSTESGLGSFEGLLPDNFVVQCESLGILPLRTSGTVTLPKATPAGNILLAFARSTSSSAASLTDGAGNAWTPLFSIASTQIGHYVTIWRAVSNGIPPNNNYNFSTPGTLNSSFFVLELASTYSGSLIAHTSGAAFTSYALDPTATTSDGNILSVPITVNSLAIDLFEISVIPPGGVHAGLAIGFMIGASAPGGFAADPTQIIDTTQEACSLVAGTTTTGYDWLVSIDDLKLTVSDLDGGADLADLTFTVQDTGQQITADLAVFTFEGLKARLLAGFVGMNIQDYATLFTGQIDTVDCANGNTEYTFTASDINVKKLTQKIYTVGDDGFDVDSKHPKTLSAHPLDILVDALEQAGVPLIKIDTAKIAYYRDTVFSGLQYPFNLTSAPTAKDFIENELMKPLGMYLWVNNLGLISVNAFYPAVSGNGTYTPPTPPVMTLDTSNTMLVPLETEADLINQVIFDFDDDGTGSSKFLAEEVVDYDASIAKYGLVGGHTIQSQGMKSAFQGYFMAAFVGRLIALRYGLKTLTLDPLTLIWNTCTLEPGDIVAVTNPFVPDRVAGTLGVAAKLFEVMDRNWKFMAGQVELKLIAVNISLKQYLITPNAEAAYAAASSADKAKYMFECDATGHYSTAAVANTLG